jgi:hypothetical protein
MKMQWIIAAVVVAVAVFVFTFLKINWETKPADEPKNQTGAKVTVYFPQTNALFSPDDPSEAVSPRPKVLQWEYDLPGHRDFWFKNTGAETAQVGLIKVSCSRCVSALIALEPSMWAAYRDRVAAAAASLALGRTDVGADWLGGISATQAWATASSEPDVAWEPLPEQGGFSVPAGASGWVRVAWKADKKGPQLLTAAVWAEANGANIPATTLEVPVNFVLPVQVYPPERDIGTLLSGGPRPTPAEVVCYSHTRDAFTFKVSAQSDPFLAIERVKPLTQTEREEIAKHTGERIASGYHVLVTMRDRLDGGRMPDLGPFRRDLFIETSVFEEPLKFTVKGTVKGEVTVYTPDGPDRILMGNKGQFKGVFDTTKEATLETTRLDLDLRLVHKPHFLEVELDEPQVTAGVKTWRIRVTVPKKKVRGAFPRDDPPEYRDSAIYLGIGDANTPDRRIRIPVSGEASYD